MISNNFFKYLRVFLVFIALCTVSTVSKAEPGIVINGTCKQFTEIIAIAKKGKTTLNEAYGYITY